MKSPTPPLYKNNTPRQRDALHMAQEYLQMMEYARHRTVRLFDAALCLDKKLSRATYPGGLDPDCFAEGVGAIGKMCVVWARPLLSKCAVLLRSGDLFWSILLRWLKFPRLSLVCGSVQYLAACLSATLLLDWPLRIELLLKLSVVGRPLGFVWLKFAPLL